MLVDTSRYTEGTQRYLKVVEEFLEKQYGEIKPEWIGILENLAYQYNLFQRAEKAVDETGMMIQTVRGMAINPMVKASQDASTQIQRIIKELGISPMAKGRLKNLKADEDDDTDTFLENLTK
jgi:P27 family predicted phage terminase small subunit